MYNKLYGKNFPNNLKIARRKTSNDHMIKKINNLLNSIEKKKNEENVYLKHYLERSIKLGK